MHIISHKKLKDFYDIHPGVKTALEQWYDIVESANWNCFADIKKDFNNVDGIGNQRYVFNIKGNHYRLVVVIQFVIQRVYIRFVGTHSEYDTTDCTTI